MQQGYAGFWRVAEGPLPFFEAAACGAAFRCYSLAAVGFLLHNCLRDTSISHALLHWYDRHRRTLPWRVVGQSHPDPYRVWLSEIMLQQTTVKAVAPYYLRFTEKFPTVQALASADREDVLAAWAGLGYYSRARNLHACAQAVVALGGFPQDVQGLRVLPGIGLTRLLLWQPLPLGCLWCLWMVMWSV